MRTLTAGYAYTPQPKAYRVAGPVLIAGPNPDENIAVKL
jgi:hypothetical protein